MYTTSEIINGRIRKGDKFNLSYIEPHRIIIKNNIFLVFNYSNEVYIDNLNNDIKLTELESYLKNKWTIVNYETAFYRNYLNL